jgi:hypothetical protein
MNRLWKEWKNSIKINKKMTSMMVKSRRKTMRANFQADGETTFIIIIKTTQVLMKPMSKTRLILKGKTRIAIMGSKEMTL